MIDDFKKELKELLHKYNAELFVDLHHDDSVSCDFNVKLKSDTKIWYDDKRYVLNYDSSKLDDLDIDV